MKRGLKKKKKRERDKYLPKMRNEYVKHQKPKKENCEIKWDKNAFCLLSRIIFAKCDR